MPSSSGSGAPDRPNLTLCEIADRLELMAQALKAISDPMVKQHIIREMRTALSGSRAKIVKLPVLRGKGTTSSGWLVIWRANDQSNVRYNQS